MDLHLLDLSSIAHPIWYQVGSDTTNPNATCEKTLARVRALASGKPHFAVCADSGRSFRRDLNPEYKANRPTQAAALTHQLRLIEDACRADGFPVWAAAGYEADDIIATAVRIAREVKDPALRVTVLSADKDLLQLVQDPDDCGTVVVYRTHMGGEIFTEGRTLIEFGVRPSQIRDYLTLVGDATDNIKGAKDVGKKKAADLLQAFGTIEGIYTALTHEGTKFTPALATNLCAFESRVDDVRALVTLRTDAPIAFAEVAAERVAPELPAPAGWETQAAPDVSGNGHDWETVTSEARSDMPVDEAKNQQLAADMAAVIAPIDAAAKQELLREISPEVAQIRSPEPVTMSGGQMTAPVARTMQLVPTTFERQLEPQSYMQARDLASDLFASRLFSAYGTPAAVLSTVLAGRELGMQAMASLRAFHLIENRPTMAADAIRALVLRSGKAKSFRCTQRTPESCTFETLREGDAAPTTLTYTIAEARAAWTKSDAAWSSSGWGRYASDMLVARASAKLCRLVYADVVFGLYDPAEIEVQ